MKFVIVWRQKQYFLCVHLCVKGQTGYLSQAFCAYCILKVKFVVIVVVFIWVVDSVVACQYLSQTVVSLKSGSKSNLNIFSCWWNALFYVHHQFQRIYNKRSNIIIAIMYFEHRLFVLHVISSTNNNSLFTRHCYILLD